MPTESRWFDYEQRLNRVIAYIYDHLDDELDLQTLADVACLSPYHWHRVYHAVRGETIAATVKRLRLHRAAGYLAQTTMPIGAVARRSGYPNIQSFTRIFKSVFGLPPAQFRTQRAVAMYDVRIETVSEQHTVSAPHTGPYMAVGKAFDTLFTWLAARDLARPPMRLLGIFYDDPSVVPEAALRSRACAIVDSSLPVAAPVERTTIAGGTYAILRYKGPYADMKAAYQWLYGTWLVQSGREAADAPVFEEYLNNPRDTAPTELLTDICLPIR